MAGAVGGAAVVRWLESRVVRTLCGTGLWLGILFFAGSLTPSLVPRDALPASCCFC